MKSPWNQTHLLELVLICLIGWALPGIAQESKTLVPNMSPLYPQVLQTIEQLEAGKQIQVFLATGQDTYEVGEPFEARFAVSEESYVTLMRIATNGTLTFLTPNPQNPDGKIRANVVYSTGAVQSADAEAQPAYDLGLKLFAEMPVGDEVLNLFCSTEALALFDADDMEDGLYIVRPDDEKRLQALLERLRMLDQTEWTGTSAAFLVQPEGSAAPAPAAEVSEKKPLPGKSSLLKKSTLIPAPGAAKRVRRKFGALWPMGGTGTTGKMFPPPGANAAEDLFTP